MGGHIHRQPQWYTRGHVGLLAAALAYGGGFWLQIIHRVEGATEHAEPGLVAHWLRDSTLALPVILIALSIGLGIARRLLRSAGRLNSRPHVFRAVVASVGLSTSLALAFASPVHALVFRSRHLDGAEGLDMPIGTHMSVEFVIALVANLLITAAVLVGFDHRMRFAGLRGALPARQGRSTRGVVALATTGALFISYSVSVGVGPANADPGAERGPCPAGAPLKSFVVSAIDVQMMLNRFGDHDPLAQMYVLDSRIPAVRAEEAAGRTAPSIGLRDDAIQPLAIRANEGDCVTIDFTNRTARPAPQATDNSYGIHIDGLAFEMSSSGNAIGNNPSSAVPSGGTATYTFWVPNDPTLEGGHYMHPGPGNRQAVAHGLFGALIVEPPGSWYRNPTTGQPLESGWEADIIPAVGSAFRENVQMYHEIGNEAESNTVPVDVEGEVLPTIDPHTDAYRPGSRAINYRSEPFMDRLEYAPDQKAVVYSSYTFSDTTNIIPRGYLGDPTKIRLMHTGSEVFHVFHLHGGADRWRFNPKADPTHDYQATGLDKRPAAVQSPSARIDSQSMGPGESFDLEIESGAGGGQQGAGEFLFHCHIAHHYFAGMWGYWRVFDTLQPDLMPLPDRASLPKAVDSSALVGATIGGQTITAHSLDAWIRPQLPTQGVTRAANEATRDTADQDASVWDWKVDGDTNLYLGEPDRASTVKLGEQNVPWPNFYNVVPGHPSALPIDQVVQSTYLLNGTPVMFDAGGYIGTRPKLLFNPTNGRPAFPLLRPHIGKRPPFSPNGHSGAPYLGENGGAAPVPTLPVGTTSTQPIDPWANRPDGICPAGAPVRKFDIVGIAVPIQVTNPGKSNQVDPLGMLDVLAEDKEAIYAGSKTYAGVQGREPLVIRANIGDCVAVTYTSELTDGGPEVPFSKTNIHIHHLQFDTQGSDGVISGFSFEQSIRPYKIVDPQLTADAAAGATVLTLARVAKFNPGVWIAVGQGTDGIEVRQIVSVDTALSQVTLSEALVNAHPAGEWAGTEFVQYRWFPDVELDNVFFHDHVNGIYGWSHGMVGQLVVEPWGSTYRDPVTGEEIRAGALADIHPDPSCVPRTDRPGHPPGTSNQCVLIPDVIGGAFREFAMFTINDHTPVEATINLRAEPFSDRGPDAATRFSSLPAGNGDPFTPIVKAYPGDPVVIRNIAVGQGTNTLTIDGHQTFWEPRYRDENGPEGGPIDTIHTVVSEKFTLILKGGAGGPNKIPGDYLYHDGENRRFEAGAWGLLRVLPDVQPSTLRPLPGYGAPPAPRAVCPPGAPPHAFAISAVDLPSTAAGGNRHGRRAAFVPTSIAAAVKNKQVFPEPLVMHVAQGECIQVTLKNERATARASFHVGALLRDQNSSGVNVGANPGDQTVAPGGTKIYTFYADTHKLESTLISDLGGGTGAQDGGYNLGLYGSIVVAPAGSTFSDPRSANPVDIGAIVDVRVPNREDYRDFTLLLADDDPRIGQDTMPYPRAVSGPALVNYRQVEGRAIDANMFSSTMYGDPVTPLLRAYAGDAVKVHVLGAPGSEQMHVFNLGGMSWPGDMYTEGADQHQSRAVGPWEKIDILVAGGAGGVRQQPGDYFYGDARHAFTEAGMWGLFRVMPNTCATGGAASLQCLRTPQANTPATGTIVISPLPATELQSLYASATLIDVDGINTATIVRTWQAETAPGVWVPVGTGTTFVPGQAQVGQRLRLVVTFDDQASPSAHETVTSAATGPVIDVNQVPVGVPLLLDSLSASMPQKGTAMTAGTSGITDGDGLVGVAFAYQWQQRTGTGSFVNISGATSASFTPTQTEVGKRLRVLVRFTDNGGTSEGPLASLETVSVVGDLYVGTAAANTFAGTAGRDNASGMGGNDTLNGSSSDDTLSGDTGDDAINGGAGNDTIRMAPGDGFDAVIGGTGIDIIAAQANGTIIGLSSLASVETVSANGYSGVSISGSAGANTLNFGAVALVGIGFIDGGGGNDTITGTAFVDVILGGAGNDIINGGGGDDIINGGADNDAMNGGAGNDSFVFGAGSGADTITGFDANPSGGQDKIDVTALGITAATFGARVNLATSADGLNTIVTIDGVSTITVLARTPGSGTNQITITDFTIAT